MNDKVEFKIFKRRALPARPEPNSVYCILPQNLNETTVWITDTQGIPIKIIDAAGGGVNTVTGTGVTGTALNPQVNISTFLSLDTGNRIYLSTNDGKLQVNQIVSPDGSLTITETATETQIALSSAIMSQINNSLQSGDSISELTNDVGYITLADIPAFNPSNYDLTDFTNTDPDPFVRASQVVGGSTNLSYTASPTQGTVNSDTGTDAVIPPADATNAGLLLPAEKTLISTALQPGDNISDLNNDAGYITSADVPTNTDGLPQGTTNLYFTEAGVRNTLLTDLSITTGGQILPTDKVIEAFGKLQKSVTDLLALVVARPVGNVQIQAAAITTLSSNKTYYISGTANIGPRTDTQYNFTCPADSTSFRLNLTIYNSGVNYGSGEPIPIKLYNIDDNETYDIGSISITGRAQHLLQTVNQPILGGKRIVLMVPTPTFTTAATNVVFAGAVDFFKN